MAKVFVAQSSCIFAIVIFILLVLSVGLLVFVLKGQISLENSLSEGSSHIGEGVVPATDNNHHSSNPQAAFATTRRMDQSDSSAVTTETQLEDHPWQNFRLPKYIVPMHYDLQLHPDLKCDTFTGMVNITVNVTRHTRHFIVHAHKLTISDSGVTNLNSGDEMVLKKEFAYAPNEYYVLETENRLNPGKYMLKLEFCGNLTGGIIGFYKSTYRNSKNETRSLATSKFQPTYARRAFPCFDEPFFKSTFTVSLVHEPSYIALSNMPVEVTELHYDSKLAVTRFRKSVPMVTYLACFIVCDFKYTNTTTANGKQFRVYSTPHQVNKTKHALKFGSRVLEYFEDYFDVDFPLPKEDMVAIPDFVSGAMEHWGVITFRETNLLYDDTNPNTQLKQRISTVISHEMAHMWFGNLVTMEWWDDLWLNEGFASYIEYKGVHDQHPEWDILSQFVEEDLQSVMELDSTLSSHPIVQPVNHPDEITEIFDNISYQKGASVLRMLEFFVGKENFRIGISNFLKKYKYKNAKTIDLWEELSAVYGTKDNHTVSSIMKTWTERMGFPYVTVRRQGENFFAQQKRFLRNEELHPPSTVPESTWSIPLSYTTANGETGIIWIHDNQETKFTLPVSASEWVKFNINQTGFYLVNYEREEWQNIIDLLMTNHEVLSPTDRSNLLFDTALLAEAGHIGFDVFLSLCRYLKNETHLVPWETAYTKLVHLCRLLEFTDANILLKNYIRELTDGLYKKISWKSTENHLQDLLSIRITGLACHSGNQDCLSHAAELFQNWTLGQNIPNNLRRIVFHYGMTEIGREEHWNYMWDKYLTESTSSIRRTYLYGLAYTKIPKLIHRYLEYAMDETKIRRQDFHSVLNFISGNPVGQPFVWNFIREKWQPLVERFTLNDRYLGFSVARICGYFTSDVQLKEMTAFFSKYPDAGAGRRKRQQVLEKVQNNIRFMKTYKESIKTWLEMEGSEPWYYHRLPRYIIPEHYDVFLSPLLDENRLHGTVAISVDLQKDTNTFIVHAKGLNVTKSEVSSMESGTVFSLDDVFQHEGNEYLVLTLNEKLPTGRYRLYFEFNGPFATNLKGLYKSSYVDPTNKETRYLVATLFEPIYARKAFPCFDEPSFKTTFNLSVLHNSNHFALSNTMVESISEMENDMRLTKFEKTPPMVTYLLCIVVSDFHFKETIADNGVRLRTYSAPHLLEKTQFMLETSKNLLLYYEKYFDTPFPLKKLDMIAVPDLHPNGMENWGLITCDEETMIIDNSTSSTKKMKSASIIAHEVAHMWFGDLVTMEWWNDLWLNEGFATFVSWNGRQHVFPESFSAADGGVDRTYYAMQTDQSIHSHPIVQRVTRVTVAIFNSIAYSKGSSILKMLERYMGEDFRVGVANYLKKYAYRNTQSEDLWRELASASKQNVNVSAIMNTWTNQMNYPYISVERDGNSFILQQHWFVSEPENKIYSTQFSPFQYTWKIPLSYRTAESKNTSYLLLESADKIVLTLPKTDWLKFNVDFTGYYSVNYKEEEWGRFASLLEKNHSILSPPDRLSLVFDSFNLAAAGIVSYEVPLNLTRYLKKEDYHESWKIALSKLMAIRQYFFNDRDMYHLIKEYIRNLSKDLYKKYGWGDTGKFLDRELRNQVIRAACDNNNYDCLDFAANAFKGWMKGEKLNSETSLYVFEYGLRYLNDEESFQFLWNKYLKEIVPSENSKFRSALATVKNVTILERLVRYARNETFFRKSFQTEMLTNIAKNQKGLPIVANHIYNNWENLIESYGNHNAENLAFQVFRQYETEKDLERVRQFYKKYKPGKESITMRSRTQESIRSNIKWHQKYRGIMASWFQKNVYMPWKMVRLPRHVQPMKYNILLNPNFAKSNFEGEVEVEMAVTEETDNILIQQNGLKISSTEFRKKDDGKDITVAEAFPYKRNDFWVVRFEDDIHPGSYVLKLKYFGTFALDGKGIGTYQYTHRVTGEKRSLLATQFEATYARRVFPCFDEPEMKASFKISIIHEANYTALSNMPEESKESVEEKKVKTTFQESVNMSTYLVCFVVSDFDYLETRYKGKPIRAFAPPDRIQEAERGLNLTVQFLQKLEEFFGVPYQLPKLDSVAIPSYTVPGMEHWGVITYNTKRFLDDGSLTTHQMVVEVDRVIAHELVHQWFGNLVTMKWWDDVWLNEGVATLIMYIPLNQYYPSINEVDVRKMSKMMCTDSNIDSNPILRNVTTPKEIAEVFDAISYEKGGAVMKMLQHTLKHDFRKGLSSFLKKYAFKNADTNDLWKELTEASTTDINITEMMDTWTLQMGFPYVELKRNDGTITATQHWFLRKINDSTAELLAEKPKFSRFGMQWKIPLVFRNLATGTEHTLWLRNKTETFEIDAMDEDVIKFNPDFTGFYIVQYDKEDWARLATRLQESPEDFSTTDRYNLLHDAFLLAETDRLIYDVPMQLTKYLKREKEAIPWNLFRDHFIYFIRRMDGNSETVKLLKEYVQELTSDLYEEFVWDANNKSYFQTRKTSPGSCSHTYPDMEFVPSIVDLACRTNNKRCLQTMYEELQLWMENQNITSDLHFVFKVAIPHFGNETLWQFLYEKFTDKEISFENKLLYAEGLVAFSNPSLIKKTIDEIMWHPQLEIGLIRALFQGLGDNPVALPLLWNYTKSHWDLILNRLEAGNSPTIGISIFCDNFKTMKYLGEFIGFLKQVPQINDFVIRGCIEEIQNAIDWSDKYEENLKGWLAWNTPD